MHGSDLSSAARILAAAEMFQTSLEERPYRKALSPGAAAAQLRAAVREGSICPDAADAVLIVAGQPSRRVAPRPLAGLTPREIEVLRGWLRSDSKTEVAAELFISAATVNTHLARIREKYAAVGRNAGTKAALTARALQDGLVTLDEL